jgi:hypothetical protein
MRQQRSQAGARKMLPVFHASIGLPNHRKYIVSQSERKPSLVEQSWPKGFEVVLVGGDWPAAITFMIYPIGVFIMGYINIGRGLKIGG